MKRTDQVLILGSAPDALRARDWPRAAFGTVVAINNAWQVLPNWDHLIHPSDFPEDRRPQDVTAGQSVRGYADYVPAVNRHGGFVFVGGTMAFTAAYWALEALRPRFMTFLGCDMVYAASGGTHFYGNGSPDPLRSDPTLQSLEAKSARFLIRAAEAGCAVANLSDQRTSRLVFSRVGLADLEMWSPQDSDRLRAEILTGRTRALAARARSTEEALGYQTPTGKYWKQFDRIDPAALRRIDAMWLDAAGRYSDAA